MTFVFRSIFFSFRFNFDREEIVRFKKKKFFLTVDSFASVKFLNQNLLKRIRNSMCHTIFRCTMKWATNVKMAIYKKKI